MLHRTNSHLEAAHGELAIIERGGAHFLPPGQVQALLAGQLHVGGVVLLIPSMRAGCVCYPGCGLQDWRLRCMSRTWRLLRHAWCAQKPSSSCWELPCVEAKRILQPLKASAGAQWKPPTWRDSLCHGLSNFKLLAARGISQIDAGHRSRQGASALAQVDSYLLSCICILRKQAQNLVQW